MSQQSFTPSVACDKRLADAITFALIYLEHFEEGGKEVFASDVAWNDAKCINVAVGGVDTEPVRSKRVNLASQLRVQVRRNLLVDGDAADELFDELVQLSQHLDAVRQALMSVECTERLDRLLQVFGENLVSFRGSIKGKR
jgi:predicted DNA-binding ribbon-helix-helix protein